MCLVFGLDFLAHSFLGDYTHTQNKIRFRMNKVDVYLRFFKPLFTEEFVLAVFGLKGSFEAIRVASIHRVLRFTSALAV